MRRIDVVGVPSEEPFDRIEAKAHLRLDSDDEDGLIDSLIQAAREWCEEYCGRALVPQTVAMTLDEFPTEETEIILPRPIVRELTSIQYRDSSDALVTLSASDYNFIAGDDAIVEPAVGKSWPATSGRKGGVKITCECGWDDTRATPEPVKQAMKLLIGHWFANREAVVTGTIATEVQMSVTTLLSPYRIIRFG